MKLNILLAAAAASMALGSGAAQADVLAQAEPDYSTGYCYFSCISAHAEGFTLTAAASVTSISFVELVTGFGAAPTAPVNWQILSNDGGAPGTVLAFGDDAPISANLRFQDGRNEWNYYDINFEVGALNLQAGDYFLALVAPAHQYWATSQEGNGQSFYHNGNDWVNFDPFSPSVGFALTIEGADLVAGVPEPATWALMIGGFGLAGGAIRGRRRALAV